MLTGRAGEDLLDTYDSERRPHAEALVKKAVRVGWAMTGGQDRAAAVRRIALAAAVRSERICQAMGSTATPRLKTGALQHAPRRPFGSGIPAALRTGGLIPNPLVSTGDGTPVRLDAILAGRAAVLTARQPDPALTDFCRRHGLVLVRISSAPGTHTPAGPGTQQDAGWIDVRLADGAPPARDAGPDGQPGADRHRPPRPRYRRGRDPLPAAAPALAHPGHRRAGRPAAAPPLAQPDPASRPAAR